jgi:hypothetical protein
MDKENALLNERSSSGAILYYTGACLSANVRFPLIKSSCIICAITVKIVHASEIEDTRLVEGSQTEGVATTQPVYTTSVPGTNTIHVIIRRFIFDRICTTGSTLALVGQHKRDRPFSTFFYGQVARQKRKRAIIDMDSVLQQPCAETVVYRSSRDATETRHRASICHTCGTRTPGRTHTSGYTLTNRR